MTFVIFNVCGLYRMINLSEVAIIESLQTALAQTIILQVIKAMAQTIMVSNV